MSQTKAQLVEGFNINPSAPADALTIDASGRVGLGTSSPSSYNASADDLVIDNGTSDVGITLDSTTQGTIAFTDAADTSWEGWVKYVHSDDHLEFGAGSARRMTISSAGNVGIGTLNPGALLEVQGSDTAIGSNGTILVKADSAGADDGGQITLGSGNGRHVAIAGRSEGSSGTAGYLQLGVRGSSGDIVERARIDSSGRLGLGTAEPVGQAYIAGPNTSNFGVAAEAALNLAALNGSLANRIVNLNFAVVPTATNAVAAIGMEYGSQSGFGNGDLIFGTRSVTTDTVPTVRMRISAQGDVGIGVDPSEKLHVDVGAPASSDRKIAVFQSESSRQLYIGWDDSQSAMAIGTETNNPLTFHINGQNAERFRINTNGDITTTGDSSFVRNTNGFTARAGNESVSITRTSGTPLEINRNTNDGNLVNWFRGGTIVGDISVSSGTVSYNPFLGSHWARLEDDSKPEILVGTVLETINKLIDWRIATFTVNGEQKISTYHGPANVGDTVQIEYEGQTYDAIVSLEEDPTNSLNKHVCVKVSDTAASAGVYGVFLGWDEDVQSEYINTWNDLYCAAVGNYFIRIAAGQTVAIGDLIESDGNGCGVVQSDDIIRSKTVGKVTSTIPQETYDDGSFLVTCVLCCG
jgi:hypothetical protein